MAYIGNEAQTAFTSFDKQTITGNGTAVYTLSHSVANDQEVEVFVNNVRQEGGSGKAYTVSGNQITFSENIASTDDCYVVFQGKALQTVVPPAGSVTSAMLASGVGSIIKNASDPATNTNGSVGDVWLNTTSGQMYALTDATTNANVWTNIGDGSGTINPLYAIQYVVIAGGGGGGTTTVSAGVPSGGGGGAGGYRSSYTSENTGGGLSTESTITATPGSSAYTITIGAGGTAATY